VSVTNKIAWVSWTIICKSKEEGGLGIKEIETFNKVLLAKWMWHLGTETNGKWRKVLLSK